MSQLPGVKAEPKILITNRWTGKKNPKGSMCSLSCEDPRTEDVFLVVEPIMIDSNSRKDANKSEKKGLFLKEIITGNSYYRNYLPQENIRHLEMHESAS